MEDTSATAAPTAKEEDSAILAVESKNPDEGHSEEEAANGEETPVKNEEAPKDPEDGTPEGESEEDMDPLMKSKKHADRKIAELGEKASSNEKLLVAATAKSPELLIEMYDPNSELFNRTLADKIRAEHPEVYEKANAVYMQRQGVNVPSARPTTPANPVLTDELLEKRVGEIFAKREQVLTEKTALKKLQETLGYTDSQFGVIEPNLRSVATSIRQTDDSIDYETSFRRAFMAMYPGDYDNSVRQKVMVDVAKKKAMTSAAGAGESPSLDKGKPRLTQTDREAIQSSGMKEERYLELKSKGLI